MRLVVLVLLILLVPCVASAHGLRTAYLELRAVDGGKIAATLRTTYPDARLTPRFPAECAKTEESASDNVRTYALSCPGGLRGLAIGLDGLGPVHSEGVVRVIGQGRAHILTRDQPTWTVPAEDHWTLAAGRY